MTELEQKLRAAMHAAVDDEQPPRDLTARVVRRHHRRMTTLASVSVAACAVVAALVLAAALGSPGSHHRSSPTGPSHPASRLRGAPMPPGSDVRLMWSGMTPAWYSTSTGRVVPISGIHQQDAAGYVLRRLPGGYAAFPVGGPGDTPTPIYHIADNSTTATRIGPALTAAPASSAGDVWLVDYPPSGHARARLTSLRGRQIGRALTLPADTQIVAGVGRYLLLTAFGASPGASGELWNPASRQIESRFGPIDAFDQNQIAWGGTCAGCALHVLNVRTGRETTIALPHGSRIVVGQDPRKVSAFSSDGTLLAVQLATGTDGHGAGHASRLAVIDLATGRLVTVPGVDLTPKAAGYLFYGWKPRSHRLQVALLGMVKVMQAGYWQQGAARLRVDTFPAPQGPVFDVLVP